MAAFIRLRRTEDSGMKMCITVLFLIFVFRTALSQSQDPKSQINVNDLKTNSSFSSNFESADNSTISVNHQRSEKYDKRQFRKEDGSGDTNPSDTSGSLQERDHDTLSNFGSMWRSITPAITLLSVALGTFLMFVLIESPLSPLPVPPLPYPPVGPYPPTNKYPFGVPPVKPNYAAAGSSNSYFRMPIRRYGGYGFGGSFLGGQRSAKMMQLVKVDSRPTEWKLAEAVRLWEVPDQYGSEPGIQVKESLIRNDGVHEFEEGTPPSCCETEPPSVNADQDKNSDFQGRVVNEFELVE